ncbi:ferredoxin--NADP reductase [Longibacter sp.]|uniref:ferredoxin--NADP reductase n=1 Tax=Longibacter sp. TaxID=2045415 RepID=UPI003EBBFC05
MTLDTIDATLLSTVHLTPDTIQLLLRAPDHVFDFQPGQHVGVAYESEEDGLVHRSYSPVSLPGTDTIALMVTRYENGTCSVWLHDRAPGDTIHLTSPGGNLHLQEQDRDAVFLATGTGLTPMMAMMQAHQAEGEGRSVLIYGERTAEDLAYRDTLDRWAAGRESVDVAYALSRPEHADERSAESLSDGATGMPSVRHGYVQEHLHDLIAPDLREEAHFFVCGVPEMVVDAKETLTGDLGVPSDNVFSEGWEEGA